MRKSNSPFQGSRGHVCGQSSSSGWPWQSQGSNQVTFQGIRQTVGIKSFTWKLALQLQALLLSSSPAFYFCPLSPSALSCVAHLGSPGYTWGCAAWGETLRQDGKVGKVWFIKTKLLWDSLKAKERLQLLSVGLGSGRDNAVPSGLLAVTKPVSLGCGFSQSIGVFLLQFCLFCALVALLNPWVS